MLGIKKTWCNNLYDESSVNLHSSIPISVNPLPPFCKKTGTERDETNRGRGIPVFQKSCWDGDKTFSSPPGMKEKKFFTPNKNYSNCF